MELIPEIDRVKRYFSSNRKNEISSPFGKDTIRYPLKGIEKKGYTNLSEKLIIVKALFNDEFKTQLEKDLDKDFAELKIFLDKKIALNKDNEIFKNERDKLIKDLGESKSALEKSIEEIKEIKIIHEKVATDSKESISLTDKSHKAVIDVKNTKILDLESKLEIAKVELDNKDSMIDVLKVKLEEFKLIDKKAIGELAKREKDVEDAAKKKLDDVKKIEDEKLKKLEKEQKEQLKRETEDLEKAEKKKAEEEAKRKAEEEEKKKTAPKDLVNKDVMLAFLRKYFFAQTSSEIPPYKKGIDRNISINENLKKEQDNFLNDFSNNRLDEEKNGVENYVIDNLLPSILTFNDTLLLSSDDFRHYHNQLAWEQWTAQVIVEGKQNKYIDFKAKEQLDEFIALVGDRYLGKEMSVLSVLLKYWCMIVRSDTEAKTVANLNLYGVEDKQKTMWCIASRVPYCTSFPPEWGNWSNSKSGRDEAEYTFFFNGIDINEGKDYSEQPYARQDIINKKMPKWKKGGHTEEEGSTTDEKNENYGFANIDKMRDWRKQTNELLWLFLEYCYRLVFGGEHETLKENIDLLLNVNIVCSVNMTVKTHLYNVLKIATGDKGDAILGVRAEGELKTIIEKSVKNVGTAANLTEFPSESGDITITTDISELFPAWDESSPKIDDFIQTRFNAELPNEIKTRESESKELGFAVA